MTEEYWVRNNFDLHRKTSRCESECLRVVTFEDYERLRDGLQRIADGYGGDVASFAQQLLEGKV